MGIESINSIESMGSIPFAVVAAVWLLFAGWGAGRLLKNMLRDRQDFDVSHEIVYLVAGLQIVAMCGVCLGMAGALAGNRSLITWLCFLCSASLKLGGRDCPCNS